MGLQRARRDQACMHVCAHTHTYAYPHIHTHYICYKELGHVITEADKPQILQGRAGNPRRAADVVTI